MGSQQTVLGGQKVSTFNDNGGNLKAKITMGPDKLFANVSEAEMTME